MTENDFNVMECKVRRARLLKQSIKDCEDAISEIAQIRELKGRIGVELANSGRMEFAFYEVGEHLMSCLHKRIDDHRKELQSL
jgi:hypothetical protein